MISKTSSSLNSAREVICTNWQKNAKNSPRTKPLSSFRPLLTVSPPYTPKKLFIEILSHKTFSSKRANPSLLILVLLSLSTTKISIKLTPDLPFIWLHKPLKIWNFLSIRKCSRSESLFMKCCMERPHGLQNQRKNSWKTCFLWNQPFSYQTKNFRTSLKNASNPPKRKEPNSVKFKVSSTNGKKTISAKVKFSRTYLTQ